MPDDVRTQTQTTQGAGLAPFVGESKFSLDLGENSHGANLVLPSEAEFTPEGFAERLAALEEVVDREGRHSDRYRNLWDDLRRDLLTHTARLDALLGLFSQPGLDLGSSHAVQTAARDRADHLQKTFDAAMTETLAAQKELEQNVRSLNAFFQEAGCDGYANSVYVINHNPVDDAASRARKETSIQSMPRDPRLKGHPLWDTSVDARGRAMPITFRPIDSMNVIQTMCAAMAIGANFRGKLQMGYWAERAAAAKSVAFANVDPRDLGPSDPWDPEKHPQVLRANYTDPNPSYQSIVAAANHPVVREATLYEKDAVTVYPAFVMLGKVYRHQKVDKHSSMTVAPINPTKHALDREWVLRLSHPWLRNRRDELNQINVTFIDESSNLLGDDVVIHFNTAVTAFSDRRVPFTVKLGEYWLEKVVTHHLLTSGVGAPNTPMAAQAIGQSLSVKLAAMSSAVNENKVFLRAFVKSEESTCEQEMQIDPETGEPMMRDGQPVYTGRWVQKHSIHVEHRCGVEDFSVVVVK